MLQRRKKIKEKKNHDDECDNSSNSHMRSPVTITKKEDEIPPCFPPLKITSNAISVDKVLNSVRDPSSGAIVLFIGTVRNHNDGKLVRKILYESYIAMAKKRIEKIESNIKCKWPEIRKVSIVHRIGDLAIGDISVVVCVSSPHRAEAFEACRYAIDVLKQFVPIWKMETYVNDEDDMSSWIIGNPISTDNDI
jgi:molybdopterin synthase catalytic subunit